MSTNTEHYSWDELISIDLNWYGLDQGGWIADFMSGGTTAVPRDLRKKDVSAINSYFREQAPASANAKETEGWEVYFTLDKQDLRRRSQFTRHYLMMATKGLYSYDVTVDWKAPTVYYQVTHPDPPLHITQVPLEIRTALEHGFQFGGLFATALAITAEELAPLAE